MSRRFLTDGAPVRPRRFPRALLASVGLHAVVLGAGAAFGGWGSRLLHRAASPFDARLAAPPESLASAAANRPDPVLPDLEEPELVESEVWFRPEPEPARPEATPLRWPTDRPLAIGRLPEPSAAERAESAPVEPVVSGALLELAAPAEVAASPVHAPPPPYPRRSVRAGEQGTVLLRLHLTEAGLVERVEVLESSGHTRLDEAARETLGTWRFSPRLVAGLAVAGWFDHRVTFELDRD